MITVRLLGGASLRAGDTPISGPPAQRHRIALLALVAEAWPRALTRDRATALLWPEKDTASARRLLNLAVHVLRGTLGDGAIVSTGDGLLLDPSRLRCDLLDVRAAIAEGALERVALLYGGPLLDGFHLPESSDFGYWLDEQRSALAHDHLGALRALAERQERARDLHGRVGTCRRLVAADPYAGVHARALMRALDAAGDRAGAIHHAAEHARRLHADLDLPPDAEVAALADELRAAGRAPRAPAAIAVLPFRNLGADVDNEYFADGITEDVIAQLSKIRALTVISHASVLRFKARRHDLKQIATTLGASALLDGSVRRAGGRVRIVAQLVDAAADRHLWSETYDREVTDIFAIQSDVALRIAAALQAELSPAERTRVDRVPTRDVLAYQVFLQGRQCLIAYSDEAMARSIGYFERAIARDPSFALAHATLATTYSQLGETGAMPPSLAFGRAADAVASALRLDPELGAAHCAAGHLAAVRDFDWAGAEQRFRRALELNPSSADTYNLYGRMCSGLGRFDEAFALLGRAQELDPLAHRIDSVTALLRAGRYDEALARAESSVEIDPFDRAHATLGWAYFLSGRQDDGLAELERAVAQSPDNTMWLGQLGQAYALAGHGAKARAILHVLEERARVAFVSPYNFAYVHAGLGDADRAMDCLERAVAERAGPVYAIKGSFLFAPLRDHPRFRALLRQMRLA